MNKIDSIGDFDDGSQHGSIPEGASARPNPTNCTEQQCRAALVQWRWPDGVECPDCNGDGHCVVTPGERQLFQCNARREQTSVKAGTIFASSKPLLRLCSRQFIC